MKRLRKHVSMLGLAIVLTMMMGMSTFAATFTSSQALGKALKDAGLTKAKACQIEVEYDDGKYEVEFKRRSDRSEFSYEISRTGRILEADAEYRHKINRSKKKIGVTAARKKAAKFAGVKYATVKRGSCKYRRDGREYIYKISFKNGRYRYTCEVLAPTGKIIEAEKQYR